MADNYLRLYVHIIWSTLRRSPIITSEIEAVIFPSIIGSCEELGIKVLALNGVEDHVHVVVSLNSTCTLARLVGKMKGSSSHLASAMREDAREFSWQEGYGAMSTDRTRLDDVIQYVRDQKERHRRNQIWPSLEKTEEEKS